MMNIVFVRVLLTICMPNDTGHMACIETDVVPPPAIVQNNNNHRHHSRRQRRNTRSFFSQTQWDSFQKDIIAETIGMR